MKGIIKLLFEWLISADSAGIWTLVTGLIAWLVYHLQVKSREKEAIVVLLNEIEHAENSIKKITTAGFDVQNEMVSILPICSWDKNYQIFVSYLNRNDFKLLCDFFNGCKAAQVELEQWRRYFVIAREEKGKAIQAELVKMASEFTDDEDYNQKRNKMIKKTNEETFLFSFVKPEKYFAQYIQSIPQLSGTTALANLDKLSEQLI